MNKNTALIIFFIAYFFVSVFGISVYLSGQSDWSTVIIADLMAFISAAFLAFVILPIDKYEREPLWMLSVCFLWGMTFAAIISLVLNTCLGGLLSSFFNVPSLTITSTLVAPFVEEITKGFILFVLFIIHRREFNGIIDAVLYACFVGIGFAATENVIYLVDGISIGGMEAGWQVFRSRILISPFVHLLFTSMTGIGLFLSLKLKSKFYKKLIIFAGLFFAILLHMLWNGSAMLMGAGGFSLSYSVIFLPSCFFLAGILYFESRKEKKIIQEELGDCDDLYVLLSSWKRTKTILGLLSKLKIKKAYYTYRYFNEMPILAIMKSKNKHREIEKLETEISILREKINEE